METLGCGRCPASELDRSCNGRSERIFRSYREVDRERPTHGGWARNALTPPQPTASPMITSPAPARTQLATPSPGKTALASGVLHLRRSVSRSASFCAAPATYSMSRSSMVGQQRPCIRDIVLAGAIDANAHFGAEFTAKFAQGERVARYLLPRDHDQQRLIIKFPDERCGADNGRRNRLALVVHSNQSQVPGRTANDARRGAHVAARAGDDRQGPRQRIAHRLQRASGSGRHSRWLPSVGESSLYGRPPNR